MGVRWNGYLRDVNDERQVLKFRWFVIDVSDKDPHRLNHLKAARKQAFYCCCFFVVVVVVAERNLEPFYKCTCSHTACVPASSHFTEVNQLKLVVVTKIYNYDTKTNNHVTSAPSQLTLLRPSVMLTSTDISLCF